MKYDQNMMGKGPQLRIQPRYSERDWWESIAAEFDLGFEVLELSSPPALNESGKAEKCRDWYRSCGRVQSLHGVFIGIDPGSGDASVRELSRRKCRESCELAADLHCGSVIFHSSCFPFLRGSYMDFWAARCAPFYEELAGTYGLNVFIENSQDVDPDPLLSLMSRIKDPRVGICLDLGHVHYSRAPIETWSGVLGKWIGCLHLSDNEGDFDSHLPPGEGLVDWEKADRLWAGLGRKMPLTLEIADPSEIRRSVMFLRNHHYFGL